MRLSRVWEVMVGKGSRVRGVSTGKLERGGSKEGRCEVRVGKG